MRILNLVLLFSLSACIFPGKSELAFTPKKLTPELKPSEEAVVDFEFIKSNILEKKCVGCHKGMAKEERVLGLVTPGEPEESRLFQVVESGEMPREAPVLSTVELEMIRTYITNLKKVERLTFTDLKTQILEPHCLKCHKKMDNEENLAKWIDVENPEQSKLYLRVHDGTMPKNGTPLSPEQQDYVLNFIKSLKKN